MRLGKFGGAIAAAILALGAAGSARADLVPAGVVDVSGTGFGTVNTIMTFQGNGQGTGLPESGCVGVSTSGALATTGSSVCQGGNVGGTELSGSSHNHTFTVTNASQIGLVFNADQPDSGPITLSNLTLSLFNSSGKVGFTSGAFTPDLLNPIQPGIGNSGFVFVLNTSQAAEAQTAINGGFNLLGLSATATPALGGPETIYLTTVPSSTSVPESSTLSSMGIGLFGLTVLAFVRRRHAGQAA